MKNKIPFLVLAIFIFAAFLSACRTRQFHSRPDLTEEQKELVDKYIRFKLKITTGLGLDQMADWDRDIRPKLAVGLGFSADEKNWGIILSHPEVRELLTPEKQQQYLDAFKLPKDADWTTIKNAVEKAMEGQ